MTNTFPHNFTGGWWGSESGAIPVERLQFSVFQGDISIKSPGNRYVKVNAHVKPLSYVDIRYTSSCTMVTFFSMDGTKHI